MPKTSRNSAAKRSKPITAFALFSGAGGLQLGLEQAGIDVLVASDIEPEAEKTHKANWPTLPFIREDA
jgi:DNA (cytosine-5)-methyltransferase 1